MTFHQVNDTPFPPVGGYNTPTTTEICQQRGMAAAHILRETVSPHPYRVPLKGQGQNPELMISYWCCRKNDLVKLVHEGIDFVPSCVPCVKEDCERWRAGECIHCIRAGKP